MGQELESVAGVGLLAELKPAAAEAFRAFDDLRFLDGKAILAQAQARLEEAKSADKSGDEWALNDYFVLHAYLQFFCDYGEIWEKIIAKQSAASWDSLQNALDGLRVIKRLSGINLGFFEAQLTALEDGYPYKIFVSLGAVAKKIECSICGHDIDSADCPHRRGHLYAGQMAVGIICDFTNFDHVAFVDYPEDKRCVVKYEEESGAFKIVRYLSDLLSERQFTICEFEHFKPSKRRIPNSDYKKLGRNDPCFCGSGKKFKNCCIDKNYLLQDHVDVIASKRPPKLATPKKQ